MPRTLTYAGKNLSDFSVWWDNSRIFNKPAKLFDSFSIPNRNGALLASLRKFENIQIEYDCYIKDNFAANYANLVDYLTSFETYQRLENSEEPLTYRMGVFRAEISTETGQFLKDGRFTLVFDCKPQNFFKTGDQLTQLAVNPYLSNQWSDVSFDLGNATWAYSSGTYEIEYGPSNANPDSRTLHLAIPGAGTWTLRATVVEPSITEYGLSKYGEICTINFGNVSMNLTTQQTITKVITTTGATTYDVLFNKAAGAGLACGKISVSLTGETDQIVISNPTRKQAKPIFIYDEVGHATSVYINNIKVFEYTPPTGAADSDGTLYVDCELMDCYLVKSNNTVANYNPNVSFANEFPVLGTGDSAMFATNGSVNVMPRWWRL